MLSNGKCSLPKRILTPFGLIVETKAIYDIYGEYGLKEGCVTAEGKKIGGGYFLKQEPETYFERVLANTEFLLEPRALDGSDVQQSIFGDALGGLTAPKASKPEDIVVTVECTLQEFYNGSMKQVNFSRKVVDHDAKSVRSAPCCQQVEVKPGYSESTELAFSKMGN